MASTYLQRTQGTATNRRIFTVSMWVKQSKLGSQTSAHQYMDFYVSADIRISIYQMASDQIAIYMKGGGYADNIFYTTARYRDTSGWYHFVWRFDTTQATASDRVRMYVNGEQVTSFVSTNYPSQNFDLQQGTSSYTQYIGRYGGHTTNNFDGSMSHVHFCDGYSYGADSFGSTDSTTGEWKINTSPSVSYGNNGFFILKDGNSVTDQSGQGNNLTVGGGTLTKTEDCPSNVFATWNSLDNYYPAMTLSYGNNRALTASGKYTYVTSTLGMTSGKYYAEIKCAGQSGSQEEFLIGITSTHTDATTHEVGHNANDYGYNAVAGNSRTGNTNSSYGATYTTGDIIGIAVDLDNNKLYFSKNGTWQNSGDPTSGSTGTGAISITDPASTQREAYFFSVCYFSSNDTGTYDANFGNGYFGITPVSSAGTNASNLGIFEYDVPAGYSALCTKGLNL